LAADDVKRLIMNDSFYLDTLFTYLTHPALVRLKTLCRCITIKLG
jgi:hypothetical protein